MLGGGHRARGKEKQEFVSAACALHINQEESFGATYPHRHSYMSTLTHQTWTHTGATCLWKVKQA